MSLDAPIARKLTYDDYVLIPDDGQRHEIVDGVPIVNPAPSIAHQDTLIALAHLFLDAIRRPGLGKVFLAPLDVELSPHDVVQPDLVVVAAERLSLVLLASRIQGAPDVVVEVLSPSTATIDRGAKLERYAKAGVPEYWIVDPARRVIERYLLREGDYELQREATRATLASLPAVEIDLTRIW